MNAGMEFAHKFARAYAAACKPLFLSSSSLTQMKKCARASSGRSPLWTPISTPC